ncbi:acyltransferase family protein [Donghicola mangrovi]|uniref:Acyltransferase n=1 Tax=Donghicola mangrovi TaxID=2729614 RepID=A0A850Q929_9RHOB|nr:acyltransferase family protein [Donghicola mangrovi]NVO22995.1 acyltransferase [Donghicola mangrovi]
MSKSPINSYRPEIDGLRALAVLSVIIYHLKISIGQYDLLIGGFLGVDLFFVLSGFLITQILYREYESCGSINIFQFYLRRAKRILPVLFMVILCSLPVAWFVLLPTELTRFEYSILSAITFVSNFFWFFELSEYGAKSGLLQPFLHTWSLAIEEQFYLIFPFLFSFVLSRFGRQYLTLILSIVAACSFLSSVYLTNEISSLSFFAPSSRFWEILVGSLGAILNENAKKEYLPKRLSTIACLLLIAVILFCISFLDISKINHPGVGSIPVVFSTCSLLLLLKKGDFLYSVLSSDVARYVGKISFSLYLWHFPIFAFGRLILLDEPSFLQIFLGLFLTLAMSHLSFSLVETPFRTAVSSRCFFYSIGAAISLCLGFFLVSATDMLPKSRALFDLEQLYGENIIDNEILARNSWGILDSVTENEHIGNWNALRPSRHELMDDWYSRDEGEKILLIGDSHSKDLFNAVYLNGDRFEGKEFARFNIHKKNLDENIQDLLNSPNFLRADTIVISGRYYREYEKFIEKVISKIRTASKKKNIIIVGPAAEFNLGGDLPFFDWYLQKTNAQIDSTELNKKALEYERTFTKNLDLIIRELASKYGVAYLSRRALMCDDYSCTLSTPNGLKTMYDESHWTLAGAKLFGNRAADAGWFVH